MMVTEFESWVSIVCISKLMDPGKDMGWIMKMGECTELDASESMIVLQTSVIPGCLQLAQGISKAKSWIELSY